MPSNSLWQVVPKKRPRGSMLIWVVMFGALLTSVFFFFGTRLQANIRTQQEFALHQSRQAYIESYSGYLQSLAADLGTLTSVDFDNITGTLSQEASAITGFLESGAATASFSINEPVTIEWNQCGFGQSGDLLINDTALRYHTGDCSGNAVYADSTSLNPGGTLSLLAPSGPLHFRIQNPTGNPLTDANWHLELRIPAWQGKTIELKETFTAG